MKKFFNSIEDRFVFPIGRRTWQIIALLALIGMAVFITWFLINSTPTSRDSVSVSKSEVVENKIEPTPTVTVEKSVEPCSKEDVNQYIDSLKIDMPNSEWIKLGDSSELFDVYLTDEYNNYIYDEEGNYQIFQKRNFQSNPEAIPNILNDLFSSKGLDTTELCKRLQILKCLHVLNKNTNSEFLTKEAFRIYCNILGRSNNFQYDIYEKSFSLQYEIDANNNKIVNTNDIEKIWEYINYISEKNVSDDEINICLDLINSHRGLSESKYDKKRYFEIAKIIFESDIKNEELKNAIKEFKEDIEYYDQNDLKKSIRRYLKLYEEKISNAENEKAQKESKKAQNRIFSLMAIAITFGSIISIATILLLYSIRQLLKEHTTKGNI